MASGMTILLLMAVYILVCGAILYFCVIADPNTNDTAFFATVTLPQMIWDRMGRILGPKTLSLVASIVDLALVFFYFAVVLGCWVVVFMFVYPWISESTNVSNHHKYIGYVVFVACFGSWRLANKSSPGIITERTFAQYDHFPYDNLLFLPDKRCESTNLVKIARSKFDRLKYNENVPRYDHFCGWVYNSIGEENYRFFLLFLAIHVLMCAYGSVVTILLFRDEIITRRFFEITFFDRATGETFKANWSIVLQYLFTLRMPECCVLAVMFVMGIALGSFLGYHVYLTSYNMTTNEATKWQDIRSWYKKEKKKYDDAVKNGLVSSTFDAETTDNDAAATLEVKDGDVTCTPGMTGSSNSGSTSSPTTGSPKSVEYRDPGPVPKNAYDRGFVENWKEVLFPISLRPETLASVAAASASSESNDQSKTKSRPVKRARGKKPKVT